MLKRKSVSKSDDGKKNWDPAIEGGKEQSEKRCECKEKCAEMNSRAYSLRYQIVITAADGLEMLSADLCCTIVYIYVRVYVCVPHLCLCVTTCEHACHYMLV